MKKLLFLLSFVALLFTACSGQVTYTDNISFSEAWAYATGVTSYWVWLILTVLLLGAAGYWVKKDYDKKGGNVLQVLVIVVALAFFLGALLGKPASVAANTTKEQAKRGVYIW